MSPWSLTASSLATVRLNSRSSKKPFTFWRLFRRRRPALRVDWSLHQNRVMFCVMDGGNRWIREKAAASLNPSQVETTLIQLSERWPANALPLVSIIEQFPLGELAMLHLLAVSSICATRLTQNPEALLWLSQPEVCLASRGYAEMLSELRFANLRMSRRLKRRPASFHRSRRFASVAYSNIGTPTCDNATGRPRRSLPFSRSENSAAA